MVVQGQLFVCLFPSTPLQLQQISRLNFTSDSLRRMLTEIVPHQINCCNVSHWGQQKHTWQTEQFKPHFCILATNQSLELDAAHKLLTMQ